MARVILLIFFSAFLVAIPGRAVEMNGGYTTNAPTSTNIPNWNTGWGSSGITCWNYVGKVNGGSGVYLGYGWVLTAAHIGMGNFALAGTTYTAIPNSAQTISGGDVDLCLFQIATSPALPPLTLSTSLPIAFPATKTPSSVAMLGFGGGSGHLTWGYDTVTETNQSVTPTGYGYISNDFETDNGTNTYTNNDPSMGVVGSITITNTSNLVSGDSGGGDFTFNATTGQWELAGINEVIGQRNGSTVTFSGMVQLSTYASQINAFVIPPASTDTPALPVPGLWIMGALLFFAAARSVVKRNA